MKTNEEIVKEKKLRQETLTATRKLFEEKVKGADVTTVKRYRKALEIAEEAIITGNPEATADYIAECAATMNVDQTIGEMSRLKQQGIDIKHEKEKASNLKYIRDRRNAHIKVMLNRIIMFAVIITAVVGTTLGVKTIFHHNAKPKVNTVAFNKVAVVDNKTTIHPATTVRKTVITKPVLKAKPTVKSHIPVHYNIGDVDKLPQYSIGAKIPKWIGNVKDMTVVTKTTIVTKNFTKGITTETLYNNKTQVSFVVKIVRGEIYRVTYIHYPNRI